MTKPRRKGEKRMKAVTKIIFLDDDQEKFFGEGPCRLLHAVEETGSLRRRTEELKRHHAQRLSDALDAVRRTPGLNAYEIAGRMRWSIRCRSWEDFPLTQKFFAVGEAMAHLDYLEVRGRVCRREIRGKRVYFAGAGDKI